jgi:hypothetical protein
VPTFPRLAGSSGRRPPSPSPPFPFPSLPFMAGFGSASPESVSSARPVVFGLGLSSGEAQSLSASGPPPLP